MIRLLQLDILGFGLNEDRDVGLGVSPASEEIVVGSAQIANRKAWKNCRVACSNADEITSAADGRFVMVRLLSAP
jgi:hypothetical protein